MGIDAEICLLKHLVRATCQSADSCAAAARACENGYRALVVEELCDDRRRLAIDLVRCLLLRGAPVADVRAALTCAPHASPVGVSVERMWIDVEIAEKRIHETLRDVVTGGVLSESVRDLLGVHFLRLKLHHDQLDHLMEPQLGSAWDRPGRSVLHG